MKSYALFGTVIVIYMVRKVGNRMKDDVKPIALIVDNQLYLKMWEKILGPLDVCRTYLTQDTESALTIVKTKPVDLLISEVVVENSKITGYDLANMMQSLHPDGKVVLTTPYDCDLSRFDLSDPHFHILYKPYKDMKDIERFVVRLLCGKDVFAGIDEDSVSENESFPSVLEWKL